MLKDSKRRCKKVSLNSTKWTNKILHRNTWRFAAKRQFTAVKIVFVGHIRCMRLTVRLPLDLWLFPSDHIRAAGLTWHRDVTCIDTSLTSKPRDVHLKDDDDEDHPRRRRGNSSLVVQVSVDKWLGARRVSVEAKDRKSHVVTWSKSITHGPVSGGFTVRRHRHDVIYCVKPHLSCTWVVQIDEGCSNKQAIASQGLLIAM